MTSYIKQGMLLLIMALPIEVFATALTLGPVKFSNQKNGGVVSVGFNGRVSETPHFKVEGHNIEVYFPSTKTEKKINQKFRYFSTSEKDSSIRSFDYSGGITKLVVNFPADISRYKNDVALSVRKNSFDITFPKMDVARKQLVKKKNVQKKENKQVQKKKNIISKEKNKNNEETPKAVSQGQSSQKLDEAFLNKLVAEEQNKVEKEKKEGQTINDKISRKDASTEKKPELSLSKYIGKVVGFLALVVLFFYGVMLLLKRGVGRKTKLGFLNKADLIEVLVTHHIAPKKSLLLVRVRNQVFLVSDSDKGLEFMCEVQDVNSLLKEGEKNLTGENFDTNLELESFLKNESSVKEKNDLYTSNEVKDSEKIARVKISDQIKNKVKGLRPLQQ